MNPKTEFELLILEHLDALEIDPELLKTELLFHKTRLWRFDFAIPIWGLALEYEGRGLGHLSWAAYAKDCEKYTWAALLGWRVLRITAKMISDGRAGPLIRFAIDFSINPYLADPFKRLPTTWPKKRPQKQPKRPTTGRKRSKSARQS